MTKAMPQPIEAIARRLGTIPGLAKKMASTEGTQRLVLYATAKALLAECVDVCAAAPSSILMHEARALGTPRSMRVTEVLRDVGGHIEALGGFTGTNAPGSALKGIDDLLHSFDGS